MSKHRYFRAASAATVVLAAGLWGGAAAAQARQGAGEVSEVVVTGSFIAGTPEDAALPVNVVTFEELRKLGTPRTLDIIKNLSEIGMIQGESNRYSGLPQGTGSVNLRNIVSSRSIVIFNGRRLPDQVGSAVASQNTNMVPNAAIGRVEVLKDGGATTYGADAVGGVVNFITRKNFEGVEVSGSGRFVSGAEEPDYDASVLWGATFDGGNVMVSASYQHRADLRALERSWSQRDLLENNHGFAWTTYGSPGAYIPQTRTGATTFTNAGAPNAGTAVSISGIVRDQFCVPLGGYSGFSATPSPVCYWHLTEYDFLQEEMNTGQVYAEANYELTEAIRFHGELLYSQIDLPNVSISPGEGPARNPDGTTTPSANNYFSTPGSNPAAARFLTDYGYPAATIANITNPASPGRVALPLAAWRLFGAGGNPLSASGVDDSQHTTNESWRGVGSMTADLGDFLGNSLSVEAGLTYQHTNYSISTKDVVTARLQAALNGLGGPGCNGIRADLAGSSGCFYFNPFSTTIPRNAATGAVNPGFVGSGSFAGYAAGAGLQNSPLMLAWLYEPIWIEREQDFFVYDLILRGETHWELPGGAIRWAVGGQYRLTEETRTLSSLANGDLNPGPCVPNVQPAPVPGQPPLPAIPPTCVGVFLVGPFGSRVQATLQSGAERNNDSRRYPVYSAFGEVNLPIFDSLVANVSARWEKFISDVTTNDNEVFVPAASLRWQVNDILALRATAGETFSNVNPPRPRLTIATTNLATQFGGATTVGTRTFTNTAIKPETGFNYNLGVIVNVGDFAATLDYYSIEINDYVGRLLAANTLVNAALQTPGTIGGNPLLNCASPLLAAQADLGGLPVIALTGPCTPATRVLDIATLTYIPTQNSGTLKTTGIDGTARWLFSDVRGGDLTLSTDFTYQLTYTVSDLSFLGISLARGFDGIGSLNEDTAAGKNGQHNAQWRGSVGVNYATGRHNFNWTMRYVSSLIDDRASQFVPSAVTNSNPASTASCPASGQINVNPADAGTGIAPFSASCNVTILNGQKIPGAFNADFTWRMELPWETAASLTVYNVFDTDPPFARFGLSYDPYLGTPLGRNYKLTVTKRF